MASAASVAIEVTFDAALGRFVKLRSHELDLCNALIGGHKFVELVADVLHDVGQLVACDAQLVHCVIVGIDERHEFALAHDHKALAHVEHIVEFGLDFLGVDVLAAGAEKHRFETAPYK